MTPDDAAMALDAMSAMWPNHELTEGEVHLWTAHLSAVEFDDAMTVLVALEETEGSGKFWPGWSEFKAVYGPLLRRRRDAERNRQRAIGSGPPCTLEETRAWVAHCRDIVANSKGPLDLGRALPRGDR
jgi:hypothetical protein